MSSITRRSRKTLVDVVLICDHKWRDLPGLAALAVQLEDLLGLKTAVVPYSLWAYALWRYRPQVLVATTLYGRRGCQIVDVAHEMGTQVAVIMVEGRPNNNHTMDYSTGTESGASGADLWFTWSEVVRAYMLEREVLPPEKVIVAGGPRFDFYRSPLNQLIQSREAFAEEVGFDAGRPIVSWATNFTTAKFHTRNQDFLVRNWTDLGLTKYSAYSNPQEFARLDWETREQASEAMRHLMRARPELQLAVKPHPAEEHDYYEQFVQDCRREVGPRVTLVHSHYIWDLLSAADVHVHRMCTTGVEAWLCGVPSIDLHLRDYYAWSTQIPGAASEAAECDDTAHDANALIDRVDHYLRGGRPSAGQIQAREAYIERWFHRIDGARCAVHAQALGLLVREDGRVKRPQLSRQRAGLLVRSGINRFFGGQARAILQRSVRNPKGRRRDALGHVDRVASFSDVRRWKRSIRSLISCMPETETDRT